MPKEAPKSRPKRRGKDIIDPDAGLVIEDPKNKKEPRAQVVWDEEHKNSTSRVSNLTRREIIEKRGPITSTGDPTPLGGIATDELITAAKAYAEKTHYVHGSEDEKRSKALDLAEKLEALAGEHDKPVLSLAANNLRGFHQGISAIDRGEIALKSEINSGMPIHIFTLEPTMQKLRDGLKQLPISDESYAELQPLMAAVNRNFHDSGLDKAVNNARFSEASEERKRM